MILADVEGFRADAAGNAIGTVIESRLDKAEAPPPLCWCKKAPCTWATTWSWAPWTRACHVRRLGHPGHAATPSMPVVVIGLTDVPAAGDMFHVVADDRTARGIASVQGRVSRADRSRHAQGRQPGGYLRPDAGWQGQGAAADHQGGRRRLSGTHRQLPEPVEHEDLHLKILHTGTGEITESDLMLAAVSDAIVIGFHVQASPSAQKSDLAPQVDVRTTA